MNYQDPPYQVKSLHGKARNNFVVKVYSIVGIQLLITTICVFLSIQFQSIAKFQQTNYGLFILSAICSVITLLTLGLTSLSTQAPTNYILLLLFTLFQSYTVSGICTFYDEKSVLLSALATVAITLGITFYAFTTKSDFTSLTHFFYAGMSGIFFMILMIGLANIFFLRSSIVESGLAIIVGGIYCVYLLVDTQLLIGGGKNKVTLDSYIMISAMLYIDIVTLFLKILQIMGKRKNE